MKPEEGKMITHPDEVKLLLHPNSPKPTKGGFRTIPFILVNESFEKVASYGLMPNMVFYLTKVYNMDAPSATILLNLWSALSNTLAIFGAFIADSYLGRFTVILLGSISSMMGMTLLWLTSMLPQLKPPQLCDNINSSCKHPPTSGQMGVLLSCFGLMSIGAGCIRPCSIAFGADQLNNNENPNNERVLQRFISWYYASTGMSTILALTIIVYIQDQWGWQIGFGIPAILMAISALMFLFGSCLYVKVKATESLFTGFIQVAVVAFKNRNLSLPPGSSDDCYHTSHESNLSMPTEELRCLNKACIVKDPVGDLKLDGSAYDPWSLCTVEQVESLKALLRSMPMWSAGIMVILCIVQNSFSTLQANTMDRHIVASFEMPAGSFGVVTVVVITIWVAFYDRLMIRIVQKFTGKERGLSPKLRMGIGLLISILGMAVSAVVESKRRALVIQEGLEDDENAKVDMSAMWLVPQYALLGLAEAFYSIGQLEFFYTQFPQSMSSIAMALSSIGLAMSSLVGSLLVNVVNKVTSNGGKVSWLEDINKGHVDYYYWLIAFLGSLNFVYFVICCRVFYSRTEDETARLTAGDQVEEQEEPEYRELPSA